MVALCYRPDQCDAVLKIHTFREVRIHDGHIGNGDSQCVKRSLCGACHRNVCRLNSRILSNTFYAAHTLVVFRNEKFHKGRNCSKDSSMYKTNLAPTSSA